MKKVLKNKIVLQMNALCIFSVEFMKKSFQQTTQIIIRVFAQAKNF